MKKKIMNKDLFEPQNSVSLVGAVIEYGRYIVVKKDGKKQLETFNGTGWAYNHNSITHYYLPKFD